MQRGLAVDVESVRVCVVVNQDLSRLWVTIDTAQMQGKTMTIKLADVRVWKPVDQALYRKCITAFGGFVKPRRSANQVLIVFEWHGDVNGRSFQRAQLAAVEIVHTTPGKRGAFLKLGLKEAEPTSEQAN